MYSLGEKLESFGLTRTESLVYLILLKNGKQSGYKIAKELKLSRSTIYQALDSLYDKGYVLLIPSEIKEYEAKDSDVLMKELEEQYTNNIKDLRKELKEIKSEKSRDYFFNISTMENSINRLKEMIRAANDEIYISTDYDLSDVLDEIKKALKRKVRILLFSFTRHNINIKSPKLEIYSMLEENFVAENTRLMIITDMKQGMIIDSEKGEVVSLFSENLLFCKILAEHFHHDIYLAKISKKYDIGSYLKKDLSINTIYENEFSLFLKTFK